MFINSNGNWECEICGAEALLWGYHYPECPVIRPTPVAAVCVDGGVHELVDAGDARRRAWDFAYQACDRAGVQRELLGTGEYPDTRKVRAMMTARVSEMLVRMIIGLAEGRSREGIVADEMSRLTPVAGDGAEAEQDARDADVLGGGL